MKVVYVAMLYKDGVFQNIHAVSKTKKELVKKLRADGWGYSSRDKVFFWKGDAKDFYNPCCVVLTKQTLI